MADKKISQLTALSAANLAPSTDVLAIVDTSATETKKVTAKDLVDGALNAGSANGVVYLNGSKAATSGTALVFDGSNLGLGVTPSAWASGNRFIDVNASASYGAFGNTDAMMLANAFWNGSNWIRKNDGNAFRFVIESVSTAPTINWQVAANSTAGSTISFTQAMTLDASGNLSIGTTSVFNSNSGRGNISLNGTSSAMYNLGVNNASAGYLYHDGTDLWANNVLNGAFRFYTNNTERARITSGGDLLVGVTTGSYNVVRKAVTNDGGNIIVEFQSTGGSTGQIWYGVSGFNANAANAATKVGRDATTLRSINAGGTVNASGADYAEYMTKAGEFALAKGDVCGINADGKLTNVFANAISFVVKSTDPSYVGGDSWGAEFKDDPDGLEAARQKVDRIAFAGQVPVNVLGATPGQYIVPINDNGAIKGVAVSNPTFEQYQSAVGKVIAVQDDGRALIIVKVA
jgi:hypothetical protein